MTAPEPKAPASDLDAAVSVVTEMAEANERIAAKEYGPDPMPEFGIQARAIRTVLSALSSQSQAAEGMAKALAEIARMTDPDDPKSYRSDDREGCLDAVQHIAAQYRSLGDL